MAFESLHDIAKKSRKPKYRGASTPKSLVSVTQSFYEDRDLRVLTIRLTVEALLQARMQIGDRVDIAYDFSEKLWRVALVQDQESKKGYAISGSSKSGNGQVRFTHYTGMPLISEEKTRKARGFSDNKKTAFSPGNIIFSLLATTTEDQAETADLLAEGA